MILLSRNYHFAESHECAFLCEIEATASRPCPDFQVIAHVSVTRVTRARDAANFMAVLRRILKGATIIPPAGGIPAGPQMGGKPIEAGHFGIRS
jgi:hypothetical protein